MKKSCLKTIFVAVPLIFIAWQVEAAPKDPLNNFVQYIQNSTPWSLYRAQWDSKPNYAKEPPPAINDSRASFRIIAPSGMNVENLVTYADAISNTPAYENGCKIVSLQVNAYGDVTETVAPYSPNVAAASLTCTCTATAGISPKATMYMWYEPAALPSVPYICSSNAS